MNQLELKVPPVAVGGLVAAMAWGMDRWGMVPFERWTGVVLALAVAGFAMAIAGVVAFRRVRTTVDPFDPEKASVLVTTSVYAWSRNPMYFGMLLVLLAWALFLADGLAVFATLLFIPWMNRFQIMPEERVMRAKFGEAFDEWALRVRRWI